MRKVLAASIVTLAALTAGCNGANAQDEAAQNKTGDAQAENSAKAAKGDMTADSLKALIKTFDEDAIANGNAIQFSLLERDLIMVYDETADRMRVITPIAKAALADEALMERMLQANYDAVLDVRYAIANDIMWVVYLHKMSTVTKDDFLSGLAQAVTAAETFGASFTSGAMVFGAGDTSAIHEDLLKKLQELAEKDGKGTGI